MLLVVTGREPTRIAQAADNARLVEVLAEDDPLTLPRGGPTVFPMWRDPR